MQASCQEDTVMAWQKSDLRCLSDIVGSIDRDREDHDRRVVLNRSDFQESEWYKYSYCS